MRRLLYLLLGLVLLSVAIFAQSLEINTQTNVYLQRGNYASLTLEMSSRESICYNLHTEADYEFLSAEISLSNFCLPKNSRTVAALKIAVDPRAELGRYKVKIYDGEVLFKEINVRVTDNPDLDFGVELNLKNNIANLSAAKTSLPLEIKRNVTIGMVRIYVQNADLDAYVKPNIVWFDQEKENLTLNVFTPKSFSLKEEYYANIAVAAENALMVKRFAIKFENIPKHSAEFYELPEIKLDKNCSSIYYVKLANLTNKFLEYKLSAENGNELEVRIFEDRVKLRPFQTATVSFELKANENAKAGEYDVVLYAFNDEELVKAKLKVTIKGQNKLVASLQPEKLELFEKETKIVVLRIENKGDFVEQINLNLSPLANFDVIVKPYPKELEPYSAVEVPIIIKPYKCGKYWLKVGVNGKELSAEIKVIGKGLRILSYPEKVYADANATTEFKVKIRNESNQTIENVILRVVDMQDVKVLPKVISSLMPGESKIVALKLQVPAMSTKLLKWKLELVAEYHYDVKELKVQVVGVEALNAKKVVLPPTGMLFLHKNALGIVVFVALVISYFIFRLQNKKLGSR